MGEVRVLGKNRRAMEPGSMREFHILNLGAGVQSTAIALMYGTGFVSKWVPRIDVAIFADTQEEPAAVYGHLEWLTKAVDFPVLVRTKGKLGDHLLRGMNTYGGGRFASIPAFTSEKEGTPGAMVRRQCTKEYKTEVVHQAIRRDVLKLEPRQRVPNDVTVHQYFGLSYDEPGRIFGRGGRPGVKARVEERPWTRAHFPLYDMFLTREMCRAWLDQQSIPHAVPRSACVCCPFRSNREWLRMKSAGGPDWARAVELDQGLRMPGAVVNRQLDQALYLHRSCLPLDQVDFTVPDPKPKQQDLNFSALECEGMCGV
jgi:hypothetical protein